MNIFPRINSSGFGFARWMHLVLEVDTEKALESMMERTANDLKESLMENKVRFRNLESHKVLRSHCNSLISRKDRIG